MLRLLQGNHCWSGGSCCPAQISFTRWPEWGLRAIISSSVFCFCLFVIWKDCPAKRNHFSGGFRNITCLTASHLSLSLSPSLSLSLSLSLARSHTHTQTHHGNDWLIWLQKANRFAFSCILCATIQAHRADESHTLVATVWPHSTA